MDGHVRPTRRSAMGRGILQSNSFTRSPKTVRDRLVASLFPRWQVAGRCLRRVHETGPGFPMEFIDQNSSAYLQRTFVPHILIGVLTGWKVPGDGRFRWNYKGMGPRIWDGTR